MKPKFRHLSAPRLSLPFASAIATMTVLAATPAAKAATWNKLIAGPFNWNDNTNWGTPATFVNAVGDTALMTGNLSANQTINLNQSITLGSFTVGDNAGTSTTTLQRGSSGALVFDQTGSADAFLTRTAGGTGTVTFASDLTMLLNDNLVIGLASGTAKSSMVINGIISSASGKGITKNSSNLSLTLAGANDYSGLTTVSAGILTVAHNSALGTTAGETDVALLATLRLANGITVTGETISIAGSGDNNDGALQADTNATAEWAGTVKLNTNGRVGAGAGGSLKISGAIIDSGATILNVGAGTGGTGTVIVSAAAGTNTYTGNTRIYRGTLKLGAENTLPTGTILDVDYSTATENSIFDLAGFNQTVAGLQRTGTGSGTGGSIITNSGAADKTLTINQSTNTTFSGVIQDGGSNKTLISKSGAGRLTLSGTNTYTGGTIISGGTLTFLNTNAKSATGTHAFDLATTLGLGVATSGSFYTSTDVDNAFAGTMTGNLSGITVTATTNVGIDTTAGDFTYATSVSGSPTKGLAKLGSNILTLTGNNTYTGTTTISGGTLTIDDGSIAASSNIVNNAALVYNLNANARTYANAISGTGTLTKSGTNTLTLSGTGSDYANGTNIRSGTLIAGADAPASGNGVFGNSSGGALVLGTGSTLVGDAPTLLINGDLINVGRDITVGSIANAALYNATIGGSNTTGTSTYSGSITLDITATNYTVTLQAATGGTVEFKTGTWTTNNKAIAIGSSGNTGTVQLSNAIATSGGINVNFGTLRLNSAFTGGNMAIASGTTLAGTGSVAGTTGVTSGTVNGTGLVLTGLTTFNSSGNVMSGSATASVSLAGSAALANSATVTGGIDVGAGTLTGTGGSFSAASTLNGGTINLTSGSFGSTLGVTGGAWNGSGLVTGLVTSSSGTFTIGSGANLTATNGVSVTGGNLVVTGTLDGTLAANSSTTVSGTGTITGNTTISGTHSPGNSPGIQSYGSDLSYTTGSSVTWELVTDTLGLRGTDFDGINVGGTLDFSGATTLNLVFNFAGSTVDWTDTFWDTSRVGTSGWLVYDVAGTTTNFANLSVTAANWLDGSGGSFNTSNSGNTFSLYQDGNDIYLNYTAVPESNVAALIGGFGILALLRRRR